VEHREGRFRGRGNLDLYCQRWLPSLSPKAILLVVHGLAEHSGRYSNLADYFAPKGYAVYSYDQRGHGRSEGSRCYVRRFSEYIEDLDRFVGMVRNEHEKEKIFLIGHSMGATVAVAHAVRHKGKISGLLLSGAALKVSSTASSALVVMAGILSLLLPKIGVTVLDASTLSRDKTVVDAYVKDPLVYRGRICARTGAELIKTMRELPPRMHEIELPLLIMHGTADRLSDPEGSRMLFGQSGSKDKVLKLYEGFYHEIFNEPKKEQVFVDMESWLTAHL
jgi:acylglycerol lipase